MDEWNENIAGIKCSLELERTKEQRRAYLEEVNRCRDPIQRLPVEIAASVFSFCLPRLPSRDASNIDRGTQKKIAIHPIQFCLGSVCRYWRQVVCSTPQMWNILWVHLSFCTPEVRSELLAEWLGRSGQLPLYVSIFYIYDPYPDGESEEGPRPGTIAWSSISRMMNMLFLNANRMRVLHLSLLSPQLLCFEQLQDANPATEAVTTSCILEELSIEVYGISKMGSPNFELRGRILSPTHVSLRIIKPAQIRIQWEHVTRVEALDIPIKDALEILKMAPQLQHFKWESHNGKGSYHGEPILFTHSSLKSLDLSTSFLPDFLDLIKCSSLEEFSSRLCCDDSLTLQNFIKRSECSLKKLTFGSSSNIQLMSVLRLTPSLTHLSLKKFKFPDEFLEIFRKTAHFEKGTFARGNSQGIFLPDLRSFTCTVDFEGFRWSKILSLIPRSRDGTELVCRPLSEIEIVSSRRMGAYDAKYAMSEESLIQAFELFRDRGVSLKITDVDGTDLTRLFRHEMHADE